MCVRAGVRQVYARPATRPPPASVPGRTAQRSNDRVTTDTVRDLIQVDE
jgi:hypothetical protein